MASTPSDPAPQAGGLLARLRGMVQGRKPVEADQKFALSRTVVDYVLREKVGVLCSDASKDERFNMGQSVIKLGIREVICVPMKGRHETLGVQPDFEYGVLAVDRTKGA